MKLINLIEENFKATTMPLSRESDGDFNFYPQVFSLKSDMLVKIKELPFCDEFKNVVLNIIHSPEVKGGTIKTTQIDKNTIIGFGSGTYYLYQINTLDFKTFDLRGCYIPNLETNSFRGHNLEGLTDEQISKIKRMIDESGLTFINTPGYIENRIADYRKENAAEKLFEESMRLSRIEQVNRSLISAEPFSPETIKEGAENIAEQKLTADNFDEVMRARTNSSNMMYYESSLYNTINHSDDKKEYFGKNQETNFDYLGTQKTILNEIKNMETNIENKQSISYHQFINTPGASLMSMDDFIKNGEKIEKWFYSDRKITFDEFMMQNMWKEWKELTSKEDKPIKEEDKSYNNIASEMEKIESVLESCEGFDEEQILLLKEKIKNFEAKLKDKVKPKTITISSLVHNKIKNYCNSFGLKIGDWVEETLLNALDCSIKSSIGGKMATHTQTHEEWLENGKEELMKKWKEYKKINKLIKTDFLILKPKFKFKGFSFLDHKPMYDYLGTDKELQNVIESIKCKVYLTTDKRELDNLTYLTEFAEMPVEGLDVNLPEEVVDLEKLTSDGLKKLINILAGKK